MFQWLSRTRRHDRRIVVDALYEEIVDGARRAELYERWLVPDTPLGRFEMMSLHLFLVLHRLRGNQGAAREVAQELTDHFFLELDHSLRELGIGDMGVPKRMKKLARMFYGRLAAYGEAVDAQDQTTLAEALKRNIAPERERWDEATELAAYVIRAKAVLEGVEEEVLLTAKLRFPSLWPEGVDHVQ